MPGGVLLLGVVILASSNWLTLAQPALSFLYYCGVIGGMLLAWRFHSSRIFSGILVVFLAEQALGLSGAGHALPDTPGSTAIHAITVLVPLNFLLIALMNERGFTVSSIAPVGLCLFVQCIIVAVMCRAAQASMPISSRAHHLAPAISLPGYGVGAFCLAGVFLFGRFLFTRKLADSALFWSLVAFSLALRFADVPRTSILYFAAAVSILAAAIIENSYLLAYHDELTTLPSRRAFNDALLRLQQPYSIAVVDIDHFKRFNDTYGHDIGDQVLRLVASNLARVTGGGQAYRCGGEEFSILFPGKTMPEVLDHLEQLRAAVEHSQFRMRTGDRRQVPRGPDRRNERSQGRARKGDAIRQLAQEKPSTSLSVTVSIGVATSTKQNDDPDLVQKAADKALYRAKANGRNRVETASASHRSRIKAAGIA